MNRTVKLIIVKRKKFMHMLDLERSVPKLEKSQTALHTHSKWPGVSSFQHWEPTSPEGTYTLPWAGAGQAAG